jgi:hypothetical protein
MLHIITPSHFTTSEAIFGLMRMTIRQLPQENHQVIVIGDVAEAKRCLHQGVPVLGSCGGDLNASKTLQNRLCTYMKEADQGQTIKLIAWGWHSMSVTTNCSWEFDSYAFIDEVDLEKSGAGGHTVIPTSQCAIDQAEKLGVSRINMTDPIVGVEPNSIVVDKEAVFEMLNWDGDGLLISVLGDLGSWQEILSVAFRLQALHQKCTLVLPPTYRDRALLMRAAKSRGLDQIIQDLPVVLRQIDVLLSADCAWCPSIAPFDTSSNVLDVLSAASEMTPLAVPVNHPVASIPTIGSQIAWSKDEKEVCGWMLDLKTNMVSTEQVCAERVETVRSISTPTRFIEAIQIRMRALV